MYSLLIISAVIKCKSLRKISKYFEIFLGIQISHQTTNNKEFKYSGYYL